MKKTITLFTIAAITIAAYSCNKKSTDTLTTTAYLDLPAIPYNYTAPGTQTISGNYIATLGRVLFYDSHLSLNNAVSCGSCHKQSLAFGDNVAFSAGYEGRPTKRNSIALNMLEGSSGLFWDGRESNIANLSLRPLTSHVEMGIDDPTVLPAKLSRLPYYQQLFTEAYGDNNITTERISSAIAAFITSINSGVTRFDQYEQGNVRAMTAQEVQGMGLFDTKYNCAGCHTGGSGGYTGSSFSFKDIGLDNTYTDMGRGTITGRATDNGTFKVPNLRNVALTAPYMHDGRYKTLGDVIDHYSHNIYNTPNLDPLLKDKNGNAMAMNITDAEKQAIVAFLATLTDYSTMNDPKFSNPFKVK